MSDDNKGAMGFLGTLLAIGGAAISLVLIVLAVFGLTPDFIPTFSFLEITVGFAIIVGNLNILRILWALLILLIGTARINIGEPLLEGILLIILGVLLGSIGGILAILGGVLVVLDVFF